MRTTVSERTARRRSRLIKASASVMVAVLASLLMVNVAVADRQQLWDVDSVDLTAYNNAGPVFPPEIRYQIRTSRYVATAKFGINQWNRLKPVCIKRDTAVQINDLTIGHYNNTTSRVVGVWKLNVFGADSIDYNRYQMDQASANNFYGVGVHEMGHALGLGHPSNNNVSGYFATHSIMYFRQSDLRTWRSFDRGSYNQRWGDLYNRLQKCNV